MFCPQCHVEYRPGFHRCTDCDLDLVDELPLAKAGRFESGQSAAPGEDDDPFCSFWQGDDPRLHAELTSVLDEAGIPHKTVRRQDHLFNLNNYPAFQIGVPFSLFEKAETVVKHAYEMDGADPHVAQALNPPSLIPDRSRVIRELPGALAPCDEENIPGPPQVAEGAEWACEDREVEVWSGCDTAVGDMLVASLRENQIDTHRESSADKQWLLVRSTQETRAREIVKEVVEGVPPE